jgi:hypothetical protein
MSLLIEFQESGEGEGEATRGRAGQVYLVRRLRELGLQVLEGAGSCSHQVQVLVQENQVQAGGERALLEREADRQRLLLYNTKGLLQEFELALPRSTFRPCDETGALFTESQRNYLLLSVIERLTTDEEFVNEFQPPVEGEEAEAPGDELLETCCTLGIVKTYFPPQASDPNQHLQHFRRALYSWRCDRTGD